MDSRLRGNERLASGHRLVLLVRLAGEAHECFVTRHAMPGAKRSAPPGDALFRGDTQTIDQTIHIIQRMRSRQRNPQPCRPDRHCRGTNRRHPDAHFLQARHRIQRRLIVADDERLNRRLGWQ